MPAKLYYLLASPPARAAELTLRALEIPHELVNVNLAKGEQKSDEFLKLNPQHTIPVLVEEDGFSVADSHAINAYLIDKYAKDDKLYPKELKARATVDHRLFYDCGVLFQSIRAISKAFIFDKSITSLTRALADPIIDGYNTLERYLASTKFIAADHVTIADFSVLTTLVNMQVFVPLDKEKYPKVAAYIQRGNETIPGLEELNKSAMEVLKGVYFKDLNIQIS